MDMVTQPSNYKWRCREIIWCTNTLTHWGRVMHLCISKLTNIASHNGLSPGRRQAIIWNNAGILLIGPLGTNISEILIEIQTFSLKKIRLKMLSAKCRPFCLGLNVLTHKCINLSSEQYIPYMGFKFQCRPVKIIHKTQSEKHLDLWLKKVLPMNWRHSNAY